MATSKSEVITTYVKNEVEWRLRPLHLGFRWHLDDWNTTIRHRSTHAWYRNRHVDVETRSTYKLGCEQGRNAIPMATPNFSRMPRRLEHFPISKYARMVPNSAFPRPKYFRFRCRHDLQTGSIYKRAAGKQWNYSNMFSTMVGHYYTLLHNEIWNRDT